MLWKPDAAVTAARLTVGWREFHRECGATELFFDHVEGHPRPGYTATVYAVARRRTYIETVHLADGRGPTPIEAIAAAYRAAGRPVAAAEPWLDRMLNPAPAVDLDALLGGPEPVLEDLIG